MLQVLYYKRDGNEVFQVSKTYGVKEKMQVISAPQEMDVPEVVKEALRMQYNEMLGLDCSE